MSLIFFLKSITASPVFTKVKKVKVEMPPTAFSTSFEATKNLSSLASLYPFAEREPSPDLVFIGIELSIVGQAPTQEITIFIEFLDGCEVFHKHDAIGGLRLPLSRFMKKKGERECSVYRVAYFRAYLRLTVKLLKYIIELISSMPFRVRNR
jgi:hypothetical protein